MIKNLLKELISLRKDSKEAEITINNEDKFIPSEKQWQKFIDFIGSNRITETQIEEIIIAMSGKEGASVIQQIKKEMEDSREYAEDIRKLHPTITATELQICCYIIEGKSSEEISQLMGVGGSTITSNRCRIRTKLGISKERSLKVYLDSVTRLKKKNKKK